MCLHVTFFLPCTCTSLPSPTVNSMKYYPTVIVDDKYHDYIFNQ